MPVTVAAVTIDRTAVLVLNAAEAPVRVVTRGCVILKRCTQEIRSK